jgi:hypothetical protein
VPRAPADSVTPAPAPRPGRLLVANSVVVMGVSIFWISTAIAMPEFGLVLLGVFAVAVLGCEYRTCVGCSVRAATKLVKFHAVGFVFSCTFLMLFVIAFMSHKPLTPATRILAVLVVMVVSAACGSYGHWHWSKKWYEWRAREPLGASDHEERPFQFTIRDLFAVTTVVSLIAALTSWIIRWHFFQ